MKSRHKLLIKSGIALFTIYYAYDVPAALNRYLSFNTPKSHEKSISALYSAYSFPNIICPIFFGFLTKFSKFKLASVLISIVFLGHLLVCFGIYTRSLTISIIGRLLFGIGSESFSVIQNKILIDRFRGKELALAMGAFNGFGRLGTVCNFFLTPVISSFSSPLLSSIIALCLLIIGLLSSIKLILEKNNDSSLFQDSFIRETIEENMELIIHENAETPHYNDIFDSNYLQNNPTVAWESQCKDPNYILETQSSTQLPYPKKDKEYFLENKISAHFNPSFKNVVLICFLFSMVWSPFYNIAPLMFQKKYEMGVIESSRMLGFVEFISLGSAIIIGSLVDRFGFKLICIFFGSILICIAHMSIYKTLFKAFINVIILGVSAPLIACYWPCIPKLISDEYLACGFAIMYCVINVAYTVSPMIVANLISIDPSYDYVEIYVLFITVLAILSILKLIHSNWRYKIGLNDKEKQIP